VLDGLALGHVREGQCRWHRARVVLAVRHQRGAECDNSVVVVLDLVGKDRAPEPGETVGIGTVDRQLGELTGHVRTSQSRSGSANGHTLPAAILPDPSTQPPAGNLDSLSPRLASSLLFALSTGFATVIVVVPAHAERSVGRCVFVLREASSGSYPGSLAAKTSTGSITGGCASSSGAWAIS